MLNVTLYNNKSSGEVLAKDLDMIVNKAISQYDIMSVEDPQLILSGSSVEDASKINYLYIIVICYFCAFYFLC